ncbi:hypothetical protein ACWFOP_28565 [Bacillus mycoides]
MSDEVQYDTEVSSEDAYEAALVRCGRTQHALVLAEARIIAWKRRYSELLKVCGEWESEALRLRARYGVGALGGGDGQDQGAAGGTEPEREADRAA